MSSLRTLCCFPSVKKQKHDFIFFFRSMYNKTIIRFSFCDNQSNQGQSKGYQPSASADNPSGDLACSGYHKNFIQWLFNNNSLVSSSFPKCHNRLQDEPIVNVLLICSNYRKSYLLLIQFWSIFLPFLFNFPTFRQKSSLSFQDYFSPIDRPVQT